MKILAVSDVASRSLEALVEKSPQKLKDIDLIISCGDLEREYLETLVESLKTSFLFVCGNHTFDIEPENKATAYIAGNADLHGRVEPFKNYLFAGFAGSKWYNGNLNQYTENEMAKVVRKVKRKIKWYHLQDKLHGREPREIIVISHAPICGMHDQPDICHSGFKCFREFINEMAPLLWIHGHIHLADSYQNQISLFGKVTVVNAFGSKVIEINRRKIEVNSRFWVDN